RSIEVGHFLLGDFSDLFTRKLCDLGLVRNARTAFNAAGLFDQDRRGRGLGYESERVVCVNRDNDGDNHTHVVLCAFVEFLRERHDVDAVLTESRSDGRCRCCFAGGDLKLNKTYNLLSHLFAPPKFVVVAEQLTSTAPPTAYLATRHKK